MSSRRDFLRESVLLGATYFVGSPRLPRSSAPSVIVVGAGAFGGWTALNLVQRGARVTLLDAWGPGNSRASSGGETRTIRATYGPTPVLYVKMVARALRHWQDYEQRWNVKLFFRSGALRMAGADDSYERAALPVLQQADIRFEKLSSVECAKRWPQMNFDGISWSVYEPDSGFLAARRACEAVFNAFLKSGGQYEQAQATPGRITANRMDGITVGSGDTLKADVYVFAPGPWIDGGKRPFFGVPGNHWRGFKIADDTRGPVIDPSTMEREISEEKVSAAREYLRTRFPALVDAPLLESRVCQYENSTDHYFILDRHPEAENVWIVGGGSGHGFKHGPVMGEMVRDAILGLKTPAAEFQLDRLLKKSS